MAKEKPELLAYDYPLMAMFWTMTMFFMWALWVFTVIWCFIDNFRRADHSGGTKALWTLSIILVPVVGVIAYLTARPRVAVE